MPESIHNPLLMTPKNTALLVIDMQEKLLPSIDAAARVTWNTRRLLDGAAILEVPVLGTEQYPKGLGATVPEIAERLGEVPEKLEFSSCNCVAEKLTKLNRPKVLLAGIEAHVCVQQTALDLLALGYDVLLAVDAIGSRFRQDKRIALRRMESCGVTLTTTEAALFEWCRVAGTPQFKQISGLVRETEPS
ncbi:hydrolase [Blastopirellula marina]|uniref:Hydrolase n=1 Tax=Blastopirellula marina TaxID=124 RepID=A0A2S8GLF1_9BACT|nr:hydrolase [Blastopirellula marina]PQO45259.1 hydrolase [Blastopirellula marina]